MEAIAEFRRHRPDVTLMTFVCPYGWHRHTNRKFAGISRPRVIILTTSDGDGDIQRAMRAGARVCPQEQHMDELLSVIRSVHAGRRHVSPEWRPVSRVYG